jgi:hypothetical protein
MFLASPAFALRRLTRSWRLVLSANAAGLRRFARAPLSACAGLRALRTNAYSSSDAVTLLSVEAFAVGIVCIHVPIAILIRASIADLSLRIDLANAFAGKLTLRRARLEAHRARALVGPAWRRLAWNAVTTFIGAAVAILIYTIRITDFGRRLNGSNTQSPLARAACLRAQAAWSHGRGAAGHRQILVNHSIAVLVPIVAGLLGRLGTARTQIRRRRATGGRR